jgi:hypothetical protein
VTRTPQRNVQPVARGYAEGVRYFFLRGRAHHSNWVSGAKAREITSEWFQVASIAKKRSLDRPAEFGKE